MAVQGIVVAPYWAKAAGKSFTGAISNLVPRHRRGGQRQLCTPEFP
jgi:hypothetical protein